MIDPTPQMQTFEQVYVAEYGRTVGLAALLVDDVATAEEITQDAFVALHRNWSKVLDPVPYLRRCVVNGGRDVQRRRAVRRRHPADRSTAHCDLDFNHLDDVLATLTPRQRAAIALRYCEDLSEIEIAEALGVRPATVRTLVRRGLARMRQQLSHPDAELATPHLPNLGGSR